MKKNKKLFLLQYPDNSFLFLHSYRDTDKLVTDMRAGKTIGYYGKEPSLTVIDKLKASVSKIIYSSLEAGINRKNRVFSLGIFGLVFVSVFTALFFLVPDGLPLVDETVLGLASAYLVLKFFVKKKPTDINEEEFGEYAKKTLEKLYFEQSRFINDVEHLLVRATWYESKNTGELIDHIKNLIEDKTFSKRYDPSLLAGFCSCIKELIRKTDNKYKLYKTVMHRGIRKTEFPDTSSGIRKNLLALVLLYREFSNFPEKPWNKQTTNKTDEA